jgi:hypothetical protein
MGKEKVTKKKCCQKYKEKGKCCSKCPLSAGRQCATKVIKEKKKKKKKKK